MDKLGEVDSFIVFSVPFFLAIFFFVTETIFVTVLQISFLRGTKRWGFFAVLTDSYRRPDFPVRVNFVLCDRF